MKLNWVALGFLLLLAVTSAKGAPGPYWIWVGWSNSPDSRVTEHHLYWGSTSGPTNLLAAYTNPVPPVFPLPLVGFYTNYAVVRTPTNNVTISNLVSGSTYYFTVLASDGVDESVPSNEISTKMKPGKPKDLVILNFGTQ